MCVYYKLYINIFSILYKFNFSKNHFNKSIIGIRLIEIVFWNQMLLLYVLMFKINVYYSYNKVLTLKFTMHVIKCCY